MATRSLARDAMDLPQEQRLTLDIEAAPMTRKSPAPPRLAPDRPLPPYAYQPGRNPHPVRDPGGHSFGKEPDEPDAPDPTRWRECGDYLYGIDLFNHGFYWEAHEAWEGLWHALGRRGVTATYVQALINLAAAGFKARWGNVRGVRANAQTAARLFESAARQLGPDSGRYMGLEVRVLLQWTTGLAAHPTVAHGTDAEADALSFEFLLHPE